MYAHLSSPLNFIVSRNLNDHFFETIFLHQRDIAAYHNILQAFHFMQTIFILYFNRSAVSGYCFCFKIFLISLNTYGSHQTYPLSLFDPFFLSAFEISVHFFPFILIENFSAKQNAFTKNATPEFIFSLNIIKWHV